MLRRPHAPETASHHYADACAQRLTFLHAVCREDHTAFASLCRDVADDLPHEATSHSVHSRARLIQNHDLRRADHSHGHAQLAPVASRVSRSVPVRKFYQVHLHYFPRYHRLHLRLAQPLHTGVQLQMLLTSQQIEKSVELRTVPYQAANHFRVVSDVVPAKPHLP